MQWCEEYPNAIFVISSFKEIYFIRASECKFLHFAIAVSLTVRDVECFHSSIRERCNDGKIRFRLISLI